MESNIEGFFSLLFQYAPPGTLYYGARILKPVKKAYPKFYSDPNQLIAAIKEHQENDQADFYFSPAFYKRQTKAIKSNVAGAGCVWVDCDDGLPEFEQEPNFLLETSPERYHAYWILERFRPAEEIEAINRTLAYQYNTDKSGWDCTQLLRPPGSYNRRRSNHQTQIRRSDTSNTFTFSEVHVDDYKSHDRKTDGGGGSIESLFAELVFTQRVRDLIFSATGEGTKEKRSGLIYHTACELVGMRLRDDQILQLLQYQDARLHKFTDRHDQVSVLQGVIEAARKKTGTVEPIRQEKPLYQIWRGNKEFFLATEEDKFLVQHIFFEEGILVVGGEPGSGKSRFALDILDSISCGADFIGKEVGEPRKCAYLGLDMPARRVRSIRMQQSNAYTKEQQDLINENMTLLIRGSGMDMTDTRIQEQVQSDLVESGAAVICIDVIGRAVPTLNEDVPAQIFLNWAQDLVNDYQVSFLLVTHTRKVPVGNKAAYKLDDLYGSRHWSITPDTCIILEDQGKGKETIIHVNKDRSGELGDEFRVFKDYDTSHYSLVTGESKSQDKQGEQIKMGEKGVTV